MMNNLVFVENGRVVTDSLTVAEVFGKRHNDVLRDIDVQLSKLDEIGESEWGLRNFAQTHYEHHQNKQQYRKYILTEDAFSMVVMAYVTPEAMRFKVRFINEFNRMKQQLITIKQDSYMIDDPIARAQRWIEEYEEKAQIQQQLQIAAPKAQKYDAFLDAEGYMSMNDVAKALNVGRNRLFDFLRWAKILMQNNTPYQQYMRRKGAFKVISSDKFAKPITRVSPKGFDIIADIVSEKWGEFEAERSRLKRERKPLVAS